MILFALPKQSIFRFKFRQKTAAELQMLMFFKFKLAFLRNLKYLQYVVVRVVFNFLFWQALNGY